MQDILRNTRFEKQKTKAWLFSIGITIVVTSFMFLNPSGDEAAGAILQMDPILLLFMNAISTIFVFFGISVLLIYFAFKIHLTFFFREMTMKDAGLIFIILFSGLVCISVVGEWNLNLTFPDKAFDEWARNSEETLRILTEHVTNFQSTGHYLFAMLTIAVIPAVVEELLFRGLLQNLFIKAIGNSHVGILIVSVVFGVIHFQFFGVFPRILLGAIFGYLYFWSANLSVPIFAHFLNNGIGITIYFLYQRGGFNITPEQMNTAAPLPLVLISLVILLISLFYFRKTQLVNHE